MFLGLVGGLALGALTGKILNDLGMGRVPALLLGVLIWLGVLLHVASQAAGDLFARSIFH